MDLGFTASSLGYEKLDRKTVREEYGYCRKSIQASTISPGKPHLRALNHTQFRVLGFSASKLKYPKP